MKVSLPSAPSVTVPWSTATVPWTAIAVPLMAVTVLCAPSKLSLASTSSTIDVSSLVVNVSSATSCTGVTVMAIVSVSVRLPSPVETVIWALPW
ncbi:hypothetical protein CDEF62S_04813 [Castellaniella defragrans]